MNDIPQQYGVVAGAVSADRERAVDVWLAGGFGDPDPDRQRARFDWLYRQCPHGEAQVNFLLAPGKSEPVGFLGVSLRRWMLDGEPVRGGVLVDFVVHPDHRSAAPALQLQRRGRERARESARLLFGLPEPKAVAVFKRLGSNTQGTMPRYVRVLRFGLYLRRRMPGWLASATGAMADLLDGLMLRAKLLRGGLSGDWQAGFDAGFDALWQRCAKHARCIGVRDQDFLKWRFGSQPGHEYRVFAVRSRDAATLEAYFVCERNEHTLVVKDLLAAGSGQLYEGLLRLCLAARAAGYGALSVPLLADDANIAALRRAGLVERDSRPFFGLVGESSGDRRAASEWYVTQADEDI
jgi:hypothetical protein